MIGAFVLMLGALAASAIAAMFFAESQEHFNDD